eukprot:643973-Prymnesium_polylepis.2
MKQNGSQVCTLSFSPSIAPPAICLVHSAKMVAGSTSTCARRPLSRRGRRSSATMFPHSTHPSPTGPAPGRRIPRSSSPEQPSRALTTRRKAAC